MDKSFPIIPLALLEILEERYPERCPDTDWSDRDIWVSVGQRKVVRQLRSIYEEQNENILNNNLMR